MNRKYKFASGCDLVTTLLGVALLGCTLRLVAGQQLCSGLCSDGSTPNLPDELVNVAGFPPTACSDIDLLAPGLPITICPALQVVGWASCGCPGLPTDLSCPLCPDAFVPPDPSLPIDLELNGEPLTCGLAQAAAVFNASLCEPLQDAAAATCCTSDGESGEGQEEEEEEEEEEEGMTIFETLETIPSFSTLFSVISASSVLTELFNQSGSMTLFAPIDAALAGVDAASVTDEIVQYHAIDGALSSFNLEANDGSFLTLQGTYLEIDHKAKFQKGTGSATFVGVAPNKGKLVDDLVNINANNGVIHGINSLLQPTNGMDCSTVIASHPSLTTLNVALAAAGLTDTIATTADITVLAPVNSGFARIQDTVDSLLLEENVIVLATVLTYHVIPSVLFLDDFVDGDLTSLEGIDIAVNKKASGKVRFNGDSKIRIQNIQCSNGVIHVIRNVLVPPGVTVP